MSIELSDEEHAALFRMRCDVRDFHMKFGLPQHLRFEDAPKDLVKFREKFLEEESREIANAVHEVNNAELLDGLIDLAYVAIGTLYVLGYREFEVIKKTSYVPNLYGLCHVKADGFLNPASGEIIAAIALGCRRVAYKLGFQFDIGWRRVCEANLKKVRATDENGKRKSKWDVVKPEGWVAPRMEDLV